MNQLPRNISSLEVAVMVGRDHKDVLRDIRNIISHLGDERKIAPNYFIESTYKDDLNRTKPCFLLTKKGCELYGTRMTGEKGTQFAVKYIDRFNEMEEVLKEQETKHKLPSSYKEALAALLEQVEQNEQLEIEKQMYQQQVADMQPKVTYVDEVLKCTDLLVTSQIAEDYGMSAIAFNKLLHTHGIQHKSNGQWLLYSKHKGQGYTKSETMEYPRTDGTKGVKLHTKWTQKGRLFLYETLKAKGILPTMEQIKLTLIEGGGKAV